MAATGRRDFYKAGVILISAFVSAISDAADRRQSISFSRARRYSRPQRSFDAAIISEVRRAEISRFGQDAGHEVVTGPSRHRRITFSRAVSRSASFRRDISFAR